MPYLEQFLTLAFIGFLGAASPGPDFVIVTQHSLVHGKKAGIYTSLGIALGCLFHITYCVIGIGLLVAESIVAFNIIKYLGAAYLIYLGFKGLMTRKSPMQQIGVEIISVSLNNFQAFQKGLLVNILNPKATLFFLSMFTQVISPQTPQLVQALFGLEFGLIAFTWFTILSCILSNPTLRKKILSVQHIVERVLGGFLIALGLKVATLAREF